ncbi:putative NADH:flavin oxidoreductase NADH oxidase [Rosellinia necatrix]|uniref:Putative NADH:flavin oxidoreductase NADH oxidase n=1 Tax=Rosellinia necatrix TaxID=77044 RepID=A0A1W2TIJ0_ROSNE|nr:putative NADH:flavin oxidoreductase NADH oxidase [Rosellinia necatrix]
MDAASTAFRKILHRGSKDEDKTSPGRDNETASIHKETAPAVEHETVHKRHEQREQKLLERERHQDHYKTTVQPLQEREVKPERHHYERDDVQHRHVDLDRNTDARAMLERKQAQFKNTRQEADTHHEMVQEPTLTSEHVHHHLHETVQPIIERETVMPSVTHKKIPIKETIQDPSLDEGVTYNAPISREEFDRRVRK